MAPKETVENKSFNWMAVGAGAAASAIIFLGGVGWRLYEASASAAGARVEAHAKSEHPATVTRIDKLENQVEKNEEHRRDDAKEMRDKVDALGNALLGARRYQDEQRKAGAK